MSFVPPYSPEELAEKLRTQTIETNTIMPQVLAAVDGMRDDIQAEIIGVVSEVLPHDEYTVGEVLDALWGMADISVDDVEPAEPTDKRIQLVAKNIVDNAYKLLRRDEKELPPLRKRDAAFQQWMKAALDKLGFTF